MKIRELIEALQGLDPEMSVVVASDTEGNNFSLVSDYSFGMYLPISEWSGEFFQNDEIVESKENPEVLEDLGYDLKDIETNGVDCILLWPTN